MPLSKLKQTNTSKGKSFTVKVSTMDAELEFDIDKHSTGKDLFDLVCRTIGLRETWYFGLRYMDNSRSLVWLKFDKKVLSQDLPKTSPKQFTFLVKFYPEDVSEHLIQEVTQHLFFLQVKQAIIDMEIYCPAEAAVLLASYAVQAKDGDYDENTFDPSILASEDLLPQRVIDQYEMTPVMWVDRIKQWYSDHKGMTRDEAEMEYLKFAQDLDKYGVSFFPIKNKRGSDLYLGVDARGLNYYEQDNKITAKGLFPWSEIKNISFKDKKFTIKLNEKKADDFVFYAADIKVNRLILDLCVGNHELFMNRRKQDSLEIQQMKAHAREEKQRKQADRAKFTKEKQLREELQRQKEDLERELQKEKEERQAAQNELARTQESLDLLDQKASIAEEEASLLNQKATEAENKMQKMKLAAVKVEEEKIMMERRAREAELVTVRILEDLEKRAKEMDQLKSELIKARLAEKSTKQKLMNLMQMSVSYTTPYTTNGHAMSYVPMEADYGSMGLMDPKLAMEADLAYLQQEAAETEGEVDLTCTTDMDQLSKDIEKANNDYIEKSQQLQQQLRSLKTEIEVLKVEDKQTLEDLHHEGNVQRGENKYSTLQKITSGMARARVAFFEEL